MITVLKKLQTTRYFSPKMPEVPEVNLCCVAISFARVLIYGLSGTDGQATFLTPVGEIVIPRAHEVVCRCIGPLHHHTREGSTGVVQLVV
jgi:hypothetical protein